MFTLLLVMQQDGVKVLVFFMDGNGSLWFRDKIGIWLHLVVSLVKFIYLFLYLRHHPFSILGNLRSSYRGRSQLVERQLEQEVVAFKIKRLASVDGHLKLYRKSKTDSRTAILKRYELNNIKRQ